VPGEATALHFPSATDTTLLQWSPPASPGGTLVTYDLLRSTSAVDFSASTCLASSVTLCAGSDPAVPSAVFFYLVRSRNSCGGNLGTKPDGSPRTAASCP
jgi:hypothetical protein